MKAPVSKLQRDNAMVVFKWSRNEYVRTIRRPFDRRFFHRLRYSRVTAFLPFLGGLFFFRSAAQPVFETLLPRIIAVVRASRILRRI